MESRKCSTCKIEKHFSEFNKNRSRKDGYCYHCRICSNKRVSQREKVIEIIGIHINVLMKNIEEKMILILG